MKKLLVGVLLVVAGGCAASAPVSVRQEPRSDARGFIEMQQFCRHHQLKYSFDTLDDIVQLESESKKIRLLLDSLIVYFNGTTFYLKNIPFFPAEQL